MKVTILLMVMEMIVKVTMVVMMMVKVTVVVMEVMVIAVLMIFSNCIVGNVRNHMVVQG